MLSIYRAGEIDVFENLDIVHIRLLVEGGGGSVKRGEDEDLVVVDFHPNTGFLGRYRKVDVELSEKKGIHTPMARGRSTKSLR